MSTKLYVGNLSFQMSEKDLEEAFAPFGAVSSAKIITDAYTGRSRGFGFVEMASADEAQKGIEELDGKDFMGRPLKVNVAKERTQRPRQDRW